jgi:RHS repeat-associated protein
MMYYDAADRLRVTEARRTDQPYPTQVIIRLFERDEAWYDALGRRIQMSSKRRCFEDSADAVVACREAYVQRTVWAGDQEVYEDRVPLHAAYVPSGRAPGDSYAHETPILPVENFGSSYYDLNPYFGAVGYAFGPALDQPLMVIRSAYRDRWSDTGPGPQNPVYSPTAFTTYPHWNPQGYANLGTALDGRQFHCSGGDCAFAVAWGMSWSPYNPDFGRRPSWMGSLLEDKRDANGLQYRRNRYVDPQTGRFTQPDPIGVAGGLNLYGYANSDPVNYSDPFGFSACKRDASKEEQEECDKREREARETRAAVNTCINENKFSSLMRNATGNAGIGFVSELAEYGAPASLAMDAHAYSLKTQRDFWRGSGKEYASGLNWAAKKVSKVAGGATLLKYAKAVGDKATVPTAVVGALTLGYNGSIVAQCHLGVIK